MKFNPDAIKTLSLQHFRRFGIACCHRLRCAERDKRLAKALKKLELSLGPPINEQMRIDAFNAANSAYLDIKSIFFKSLIRLLPIQYAHYTLMGKDVSLLSPEELRIKLMYLNQQPMLPLGKVSDFLSLVSTFTHHRMDRLKIENGFCQFLKELDRDKDFLHLDNSNLSGGETQILQLCLALTLCLDTLILDEAFSAMDRTTHYKAEELVLNWVQEKKNERSIIFTSHQPELSLIKPDIIYNMSRGILQRL